MEPEGSLPHSQVPATCSYPEPAQSSPYPHIPFPEDPFNKTYFLYKRITYLVLIFKSPNPVDFCNKAQYTVVAWRETF
jgi:hypothetical protein